MDNLQNLYKQLLGLAQSGASTDTLRDFITTSEPDIDPFDDLNNILDEVLMASGRRK